MITIVVRQMPAMIRLRHLLNLPLAAVCVLGLTGCADRRTELTLSYPAVPSMALILVAQEEGFFEDERLTVHLDQQVVGRDALQLMLEGKVDLAVAYETPTLIAACGGTRVRIHSIIHSATSGTAVVARRDRNITRAEDLKGKRIGLPLRSNAELVLGLILRFASLNRDDVTIVNRAPGTLSDALQKGEVDAVTIWHPRINDVIQATGQSGATVLYSNIYTEHSLLLSRGDGSVPPNVMHRVLRALRRASDSIAADPEGSIALTQRMFPEDAEQIPAVWKNYNFDIGLSRVLVDSLDRAVGWLRTDGITQCPAFRDASILIDSDALKTVDPTLVTAL